MREIRLIYFFQFVILVSAGQKIASFTVQMPIETHGLAVPANINLDSLTELSAQYAGKVLYNNQSFGACTKNKMMRKTILIFLLLPAELPAQKDDSLLSNVYYWNKLQTKKEDTRVRRQVLEGKTFTLSYFEIHASTIAPGNAPHPPHVHDDFEELIIIKEGQVRISIAGTTKTLGPGSIAFAMPGDEHGIENAGKTQATYFILKYKGRLPNIERGKQAGGSFMIDWNELTTKNTGKGYRRDFFNRATSQLKQFEMHTTALNGDSISHAPHTHVQEEIILVLRGNVEMSIDGKLHKGAAGDLYFISANVPHNLKNIGKEQCEYFAFQWKDQ